MPDWGGVGGGEGGCGVLWLIWLVIAITTYSIARSSRASGNLDCRHEISDERCWTHLLAYDTGDDNVEWENTPSRSHRSRK